MKRVTLILMFLTVLSGTVFANANSFSNELEDSEFMLIFRMEASEDYQPSQEELDQMLAQWGGYIGGIASQGKLVRTNELSFQGAVVKADKSVTPGVYASDKVVVGGYMIIKASSLEEAQEIAKKCPILLMGGSVEIRGVVPNPSPESGK
ncbi:YciI family protein [Flavobacteriaceae bacterium M23B6Z8]